MSDVKRALKYTNYMWQPHSNLYSFKFLVDDINQKVLPVAKYAHFVI